MDIQNKHVIHYLDHYCNIMECPGFALLIKGDWGSGKTWFIKNYIAESEKFLFLSLYGLKDTREIDDLIFEKIHPIISSKPVAIMSKLIKSALRLGLKIDLDSDSNIEANATIPDISLKDFTQRLSSKILIFDDLERNNIDPTSLLGYINTFVEHQKLKVILIGDEQKILDKGNIDYSDAKEKIIGHTFNISPLSSNAIKTFIQETKDEKCKNFLISIESKILELFNKLNYNNLRDLRQTILSYEYLYINIDDEFKDDYEYFEKLFIVFCYLSLELKANKINEINWLEAIEIFFYKDINQKEFLKLSEEEKKKIRENAAFSTIFNRYNIPLGNLLLDVIFNGKIISSKINESIKTSHHFTSKNKSTLSILLSDWRSLTSKTFEEHYKNLIDELKANKYLHPAEILHSTGLFLLFSDWKLIPLTKEDIVNLISSIIDQIVSENKLKEYDFEHGFPEDYGGFGFARRETEEFNTIWKKLKDNIVSQKKSNLEKEVIESLNSFPESFLDFCRALIFISKGGRFSNDPVFSFIKASVFFEKYLCVPNELKRQFIIALRDRYELKYSNGIIREQYKDEEKFLIELKEIIDSKVSSEESLYNIDNFILKGVSDELKTILEFFKKHLKENSIQK